jgi:XTP/dITP diphosphohydrolase
VKLLLATTNPGKVREVRRILPQVSWVGLADLEEQPPEAVEDGATFEENARIKAAHYRRFTGMVTVAEDSGLVVDALDGRPGVHSARYGGDVGDPERCRLLLGELEGVPEERRTARFVSCAALALPDGEILVTRGEVQGRIAPEPRGENGFGYDPVFFHPGHGRTLAQVAPEEKDAVSHRRRSLEALRPHLESFLATSETT